MYTKLKYIYRNSNYMGLLDLPAIEDYCSRRLLFESFIRQAMTLV
jgi:hypothetical protein